MEPGDVRACRSSRLRVLGASLVLAVSAATVLAQDPTANAPQPPPWQRVLKGDEAKRVEALEKSIQDLEKKGQFAEAIAPAREVLAIRGRVQGEDHWETVNARIKEQTCVAGGRPAAGRPVRAGGGSPPARGSRVAPPEGTLRRGRAALPQGPGRSTAGSWRGPPRHGRSLQGSGQQPGCPGEARRGRDAAPGGAGDRVPHPGRGPSPYGLDLQRSGHDPRRPGQACRGRAVAPEGDGELVPHPGRGRPRGDPELQQPGLQPGRPGEIPGSRAPLSQGAGDPAAHPGRGPSPSPPAATATWLTTSMPRGSTPRPSRSIARRWRSGARTLGEDHPHTGRSYNNLATNLHDQGKYAEAEPLLARPWRSTAGRSARTTPTWPSDYDNLADNLDGQGKYAEAEAALQKALAIRRQALGEDHPLTARSYNNLADVPRRPGEVRRGRAAPIRRRWRSTAARWARTTPRRPRAITTWP